MKHFTTLMFCCFFLVTSYAQSDTQQLTNTNWKASSHQIESRDNKASIETSLFRSVFAEEDNMSFLKGGELSFPLDGEKANSTWEISTDNKLRLSFTNKRGKVSYTDFDYQLRGNTLVISQEDPYIKQVYTFSKQ